MSDERDPLDTGAETAAKAKADEAERFRKRAQADDFRWLMTHKQGRRLMWELLASTGVFRNPYVVGDQSMTDFRCGEMNIGQRYFARIHEMCPEKYQLMVQEQNNA